MANRPSLASLVKDYIKDHIISHELKTGDPLPSQGDISTMLDISRGSVREAVKTLEAVGIIEVRHGNGLFVGTTTFDSLFDLFSYRIILDPSSLMDFLELRKYLETGAIEDVISIVNDADIEACLGILRRWEQMTGTELADFEDDRDFHKTLYHRLENKVLDELLDAFWFAYQNAKQSLPAERLRNLVQHDVRQTVEDHQLLLEAIREKDVQLAKTRMYRHFDDFIDRLQRAEL